MLTAAKKTTKRSGDRAGVPVGAATKVFCGAIVVWEGPACVPGKTATGLKSAGLALETVDNSSGVDGEKLILIEMDGWFLVDNDIGDPVTTASINEPCYLVDDETVAATDGAGTRSVAGTVREIDAQGVWISFD